MTGSLPRETEQLAQTGGVGTLISDPGAIPVEDDHLETAVELSGKPQSPCGSAVNDS